jgi:hypothetical protein
VAQISAAVSAIKEKGVLSGKRIERAEIGSALIEALWITGPLPMLGPEPCRLVQSAGTHFRRCFFAGGSRARASANQMT